MKLLWLIALALTATPAVAQSQSDFVAAFSGKWEVYDPLFGSGNALCRLDFAGAAKADKLDITTTTCAAPLSAAKSWAIEGAQLVLYDASTAVIVKLGGNQKRVTGATAAGVEIVLERPGGDGNAALLLSAVHVSGCNYLGYTQKCAPNAELGKPAAGSDGKVQIRLEVNLNAHVEPRADSDVVGATQKGACIVVEQCVVASDGPWCMAKFGEVTGWLRKLALRQSRWPVVGYTNACSK